MLLGRADVFQRVKGVTATTAATPAEPKTTANYRDVSSERTDHAEAVKVVFDPSKVSYGTLLRIFFSVVHDPTQLNRQGPDVGTSYRSAIFFTTPEQQKVAAAYIAAARRRACLSREDRDPARAAWMPSTTARTTTRTTPRRTRTTPTSRSATSPRSPALKQQFPDLFQDYKHK